jgi:hypothetical protein
MKFDITKTGFEYEDSIYLAESRALDNAAMNLRVP